MDIMSARSVVPAGESKFGGASQRQVMRERVPARDISRGLDCLVVLANGEQGLGNATM